jgi:hypothetical protein
VILVAAAAESVTVVAFIPSALSIYTAIGISAAPGSGTVVMEYVPPELVQSEETLVPPLVAAWTVMAVAAEQSYADVSLV